MDSSFSLDDKTVKMISKLSDIRIIRKLFNIYSKSSRGTEREIPLGTKTQHSTGVYNEIHDFICIKGKSKLGFEKIIKCLYYSKDNLKRVETFLKSKLS